MAKDGTNRGGARIGSGQKKKALIDKIAEEIPEKENWKLLNLKIPQNFKGRRCHSQGLCFQQYKRMVKP